MAPSKKSRKMNKSEQNRTDSRQYPEITLEQEKALILMTGGICITEVARRLKVGRTTIYDWMEQQKFKDALQKEESNVLKEIRGITLNLQIESFEKIRVALRSPNVSPLDKAKLGLKYLTDTDNLKQYRTQEEIDKQRMQDIDDMAMKLVEYSDEIRAKREIEEDEDYEFEERFSKENRDAC